MGQGHFGTNENRLLFLPFFSSGGKEGKLPLLNFPFPLCNFFPSPDVDFPINHAQLFIRETLQHAYLKKNLRLPRSLSHRVF